MEQQEKSHCSNSTLPPKAAGVIPGTPGRGPDTYQRVRRTFREEAAQAGSAQLDWRHYDISKAFTGLHCASEKTKLLTLRRLHVRFFHAGIKALSDLLRLAGWPRDYLTDTSRGAQLHNMPPMGTTWTQEPHCIPHSGPAQSGAPDGPDVLQLLGRAVIRAKGRIAYDRCGNTLQQSMHADVQGRPRDLQQHLKPLDHDSWRTPSSCGGLRDSDVVAVLSRVGRVPKHPAPCCPT
eukprot:4076224-Amphidinium_carterae.10